MLTKKQIKQFREALLSAEKPLFYYDDDPDGVCSYLIFKKFTNSGKGIIKKSSPVLDMSLHRKIEENNPDKVFILDVPIVKQEFIDSTKQPIYWLDHHPLLKRDKVNYFNPLQNSKIAPPTSYLAYKITEENLWLGVIGAIADWYYPKDIIKDFKKNYPNLINSNNIEELLFNSKLTKIIKLFSFILKDSTTEISRSLSILEKIQSPLELIEESTPKAKYLVRKIKNAEKEYDELLKQALKQKTKNGILLFEYPLARWSFTRELATELNYHSKAIINIVARKNENLYKMSLRSKTINLQKLMPKLLEGLEGYGGGHKFATGATVNEKDFPEFISRLKKEIK